MAYKILSLDGGGTWALLQARVLQDLYGDVSGHELLQQFDLVIANSGGALMLACLCNNMKLSTINAVFTNEAERKQIFSKLQWEEHNLLTLLKALFKNFPIGAKYSTGKKAQGINAILKKYDEAYQRGIAAVPIVETDLHKLPYLMGKENLQIVIVAFDYFRERSSFFRSNWQSETDKFSNKNFSVTLGDAVHASSNAPINYFKDPAFINLKSRLLSKPEEGKNWYWDGAVAGFNNPVLAGLIEAITNQKTTPLTDYKVLSIGSGIARKAIIPDYQFSTDANSLDIFEKNKNKPFVSSSYSRKFQLEAGKLAKSILGEPPDSASFIAYSILDPLLQNTANMVRINPCISPQLNTATNEYEVPEVYKNREHHFMQLLEMDMDAVEKEQVDLITEVADLFLIAEKQKPYLPNQFIRGDKNAAHQLGFGSYREAKEKWLQLNNNA